MQGESATSYVSSWGVSETVFAYETAPVTAVSRDGL